MNRNCEDPNDLPSNHLPEFSAPFFFVLKYDCTKTCNVGTKLYHVNIMSDKKSLFEMHLDLIVNVAVQKENDVTVKKSSKAPH